MHRKRIIIWSLVIAVILIVAGAVSIAHNNLHIINPQPIKAPEDVVINHPESMIVANSETILPPEPRTSVTTSPAPVKAEPRPPVADTSGQPGAVFINPRPYTPLEQVYQAPAPAPVTPLPAPQRPPVAPVAPPVQPVLPPVVERPVERPVEVVKEIIPPVVDELLPPVLDPIIDPLLKQIP